MSIEDQLKQLLAPVLKEFIDLHKLDAATEQYNKHRGCKRNVSVFLDEKGNLGILYCSADNYPDNFVVSDTIRGLKHEIETINTNKWKETRKD
ncbi:hypothetical protein WAF17_02360 [Bernardetia sp. ABR2-2B]|uniref:hypothetical protein n=1 Tax=Bernardetia sp. ABR2-2B TaxID=3127472 RepID=UPI0030D06ED6